MADSGRNPEAISAFQQVVKADPSLAAAWERLSALLIDTGRLREAGDALVSLARLYPEDGRVAGMEPRLQSLAASPAPLERALLAATVWTALGEKPRAAEIRVAARKRVGEAAVRKTEAALRK